MALENSAQRMHLQYSEQIFLQNDQSFMRDLRLLKSFDRVLYVGAHPDDENNKLLTFLSQDQCVETAYLSLTRGEGGQNFIGPEKGLDLGVLRVQESLAARRLEGTAQFFTRAKDFGFATSADEALLRWNEQGVLADMVWIIRYFRPTVIVSRFSPDIPDLHGHHQASAILIAKAFDLAADSKAYPEQLVEVELWEATRLLWDVYQYSGVKDIGGEVTPLPDHLSFAIPAKGITSGLNYAEMAAESRNKHRSQAMGSLAYDHDTIAYFELIKGEFPTSERDVFTIDQEVRDHYLQAFKGMIEESIHKFVLDEGTDLSFDLAKILLWMNTTPKQSVIHGKRTAMQQLLLRTLAVGFHLQATAEQWVPGTNVSMVLETKIPQNSGVVLYATSIPFFKQGQLLDCQLSHSESILLQGQLNSATSPSFPTWLKAVGDQNNYCPSSHDDIVLPQNEPKLTVDLHLLVWGLPVHMTLPVLHRNNPVIVSPPVTGQFDAEIVLVSDLISKPIVLELSSHVSVSLPLKVRLRTPLGLEVSPKEVNMTLAGNESVKINFNLASTLHQEQIQHIGFEIETAESLSQYTSKHIAYPHIDALRYFPEGVLAVLPSSIAVTATKVAYIAGKNDDLAGNLRQLVEQLMVIPIDGMAQVNLHAFDAVVLGIRIYNTNPTIAACHAQFCDYVNQGGILITQYNTPYDLQENDLGPYPVEISHERMTETTDPISFLIPNHRVLHFPNVIRSQDFENWVQDRALFLPQQWDESFEPILQGKKQDGSSQDGLLLIRKEGRGQYIYTSLSLFRQLPAGVAGAYRLFANMLSLGRT